MFAEPGFFGTKAALYMDIVTLFFALLPLLLAFSIRFAVKGDYERHFKSQVAVLALTLVMVVVFEVGVRISGGFTEFLKHSSINKYFFFAFLIVHILIALAAVAGWIYLVIASWITYKREGAQAVYFQKHRIIGKWIFAALTLTSIMGCMIYLFLFIM